MKLCVKWEVIVVHLVGKHVRKMEGTGRNSYMSILVDLDVRTLQKPEISSG